MVGEENLRALFTQADPHDYAEGLLAYQRYRTVLNNIATKYELALPRVVAAFVSLSPNNDYFGNLRSLVSVIEGIKNNVSTDRIIVSSYEHCKNRAVIYLKGWKDFVNVTTGLKVLNFYRNILDPMDNRWVTIDGHMVAAYRGDPTMTMKEAIIKRKGEYREIADATKSLAFREFILPNQYQAIVWFVRKRLYRIRFNGQGDLFDYVNGDLWRTLRDVENIKPYATR